MNRRVLTSVTPDWAAPSTRNRCIDQSGSDSRTLGELLDLALNAPLLAAGEFMRKENKRTSPVKLSGTTLLIPYSCGGQASLLRIKLVQGSLDFVST